MKKYIVLALMLLTFSQTTYAGGWIPGKCGGQATSTAYQQCVQKFKVWNPTGGPDGLGSWTVTVNTPEFKACEAQELALYKLANGCR